MPARGADIEVVTPDWSIVLVPNASPAAPTQRSSHDMQVTRALLNMVPLVGSYDLLLGSGGTDADHEEATVTVDDGAVGVSTSLQFVDNTHRVLRVTANGVAVDALRIKVAIRRLQLGGEP